MENNINIAELLRRCPQGMELYSPIFGKVYLDEITPNSLIMVTCDKEQGDFKAVFYHNGKYTVNGDCLLFPSKDKTTWEGFQIPFKDGDVISCPLTTCIFKKEGTEKGTVDFYCGLVCNEFTTKDINDPDTYLGYIADYRLATEEEKQRLFDTIKENGYKWNPETKTLEKFIEPKFKVGDRIKKNKDRISYTIIGFNDDGFYKTEYQGGRISYVNFEHQDEWELVPDKIEPKFKVGDRVKHKQSFISGVITNIDDDCYKIKYDSGAVSFAIIKDQDDWELVSDGIEPKFKVGDKIRMKGNPNYIYTITGIKENKSGCGVTFDLRFSEQDKNCNWFPKFDISTLVPFESRVLVRNAEEDIWKPAIFGCFAGKTSPYYVLGGIGWKYCIPYEGNENLCGKKDDCKEFYKTWK